jgi:hypothetical protein
MGCQKVAGDFQIKSLSVQVLGRADSAMEGEGQRREEEGGGEDQQEESLSTEFTGLLLAEFTGLV